MSDSLVPNPFSYSGGLLLPKQIILTAGDSSTPPTQDRIQWQRTSDGAAVAELYGYEAGASDGLVVRANAKGTNSSILTLQSSGPGAAGGAGLSLQNDQADDIGSRVLAFSGSASQFAVIIDALGNSSFLQIAGGTTQRLRLTIGGPVTLTWSGSVFSSQVTVNHGLGVVPKLVIAGLAGLPSGLLGTANVVAPQSLSSTQFTATGTASSNSTGTTSMYWLALG